jgi:hypothetical protein
MLELRGELGQGGLRIGKKLLSEYSYFALTISVQVLLLFLHHLVLLL